MPEETNLELLDDLAELPTAEHVARFEAIHEALSARLTGDASP